MFTANQSQLQSSAKDYMQQLLAATISWGAAVTQANHTMVKTVTESIDTSGVEKMLAPAARVVQQYMDWVQSVQSGYSK